MPEPFLLRDIREPDQGEYDAYVSRGGYEGLRRALAMTPEQVTDEVDRSGLRGRGGAGFPTGRKWKFLPKDPAITKYLVVNADEGEPGTFKDRTLIEGDPHRLIEGIVIGSYAIAARHAYIYLRREFHRGREILERALAQAYAHGVLGDRVLGSGYALDVVIATGAGAYIAGEETALLESLEGRRAMPRLKPPFYPAVKGLYMQPTALNNVETLCHVAWILARGAEWYKAQGSPILISVSGHVQRPGVYEVPLGTSIRNVIALAGGMPQGRTFKACFPGGSSSEPEEELPACDDGVSRTTIAVSIRYRNSTSTAPTGSMSLYCGKKLKVQSTAFSWLIVDGSHIEALGAATISGLSGVYGLRLVVEDSATDHVRIQLFTPGFDPLTSRHQYQASGDLVSGGLRVRR